MSYSFPVNAFQLIVNIGQWKSGRPFFFKEVLAGVSCQVCV